MNLKDLNWHLMTVSDSSILDSNIKESAKEAAYTLLEIKNLLGLDANTDTRQLVFMVHQLQEKYNKTQEAI